MSNKIKIRAMINAGTDKVWKFYTHPEHITKWNFASDDWQCPRATVDLRPGGKHSARMEAKDGSFGFDFEAIYDEILIGEKISYTMTDGRHAEVLFRKIDNHTEITIHFDPEQTNPVELQRDGWQAILNNFKKYVENN